ncbi:MAG: hypothetical protein AAGA71_21665 [Pseudomonadota bacterium]
MSRWIDTCFDWFDARFAPPELPILPTKEFFGAPGGTDSATARLVLEDVTRLLGFERPVELHPIDMVPAEYMHNYQDLSSVAGTYQDIDGIAVIRYNPDDMHRPLAFINTLAHEVMHARLAGMEHEVPGGADAHELATDLGCVIAGFGVFQMQAADDAGWSGYLSQQSRAYALARFLRRRALGLEAVDGHLSQRCRKLLRRALKDLASSA